MRTMTKSKRNMAMVLTVLLCTFLFSNMLLTVKGFEETRIIIYGNRECGNCLQYITEFENALKDIGITDALVKDLGADPENMNELHELYDRLDVPIFMVSNIAVVIEDRFVFGGYVPVEIIIDFISKHIGDYPSLVVYRDETRNLYVLMDENGEIKECQIMSSIKECIPKASSNLSSPPILPLIVVSGLLDGINPCAFAVLLFFLAFLFAVMKNASPKEVKKRIFMVGSIYIAAVYIGYLLIGVGMLKVISLTPFPNLIAQLGALLVIILGVISLKDYFFYGKGISLKIPYGQWKTIARLVHKATIPSILLVGFLVALVEFPCTGGIYVAILGMLAVKETQIKALMYLLIYNLAFVLPLVMILAFASNRRIVDKMRGWQEEKKRHFRLLLGLLMIAMGIVIFFGYLNY